MSSLQGKTLSETYKDLLQISNSNIGVDNTCRYIEDGEGTVSILAISQNYVGIGTTSQGITEGKLHVNGNSLFSGDITTTGSITFSPGSYTALHTGSNLNSLADVDTAAPSDGQTLLYDSSSSSWTPSDIPASTLENLSDTSFTSTALTEGDILEWSTAGQYWISRPAPDSLPSTTTSGAFLTYSTTTNTWEPNTSLINSSGRLGIGTSTVTADLHILHTNASTFRAPMARMEFSTQSNVNFDIFGDTHANLPGWFQIGGWNADVGIALVADIKADVEAGTSRKGMFLKNGNIGVGTTSPQSKLDIYGDNSSLRFTRDEGDRFGELLYDGSVFKLKCPTSDRFDITDVNGVTLFTVNPNDRNIGIGVTTPDVNFDIRDDTDPVIGLKNSTTNALARIALIDQGSTNGALAFQPRLTGFDPQTRMLVSSQGHVGIGTESPVSLLHIAGGDSDTRDITLQYTGTVGAAEQAIVWKDFRGQTNAQIANILWGDAVNQPAAGLAFRVTNLSQAIIDAMTIKPNGYIGIGTTSPGWRLHVQHATSEDAISRLENISASPYGVQIKYNSDPNSSSNWFFECVGGNTSRLSIKSNGGIYNIQANNSNLSDEREKKNIESADSTWNCLKNWEIKKFHYNEDADTLDKKYGVIAQQIEVHCPEVVTQWIKQEASEAIVNEDGNEVESTKIEIVRKGVKEQQMYWMAINALKEAMARIEYLESELEQANSRLIDIENFIGSDNK